MNRKIWLWLVLVLVNCVFALSIAVQEPTGKVFCFGDSITHAGGHGWVEIIGEQHPGLTMVNAGRSGRKTSDKGELDEPLSANLDSQWILFFLGVNDLRNGTPEMVRECVDNMDWMISRVQERVPGARIVLMAPTALSLGRINEINRAKNYNQMTQDSLQLIEREYRELAESKGVEFFSLLNVVSPGNFYDGLHPDQLGQQEIADAVWQGLVRLVNQ